jgi:hypothetical protein
MFIFFNSGVTQGVLSRQVLYHSSQTSSPFFFALVIFQVRSCIFAQLALKYSPPTYSLLHEAGMTGTNHHT